MFKKIQDTILKIFTIQDLLLLKPTTSILNHFDIAKGVRDIDGKYIFTYLKICGIEVKIVIVKDNNGYTITDMSVEDSTPIFYISVPYDISYENFDSEKRINIIGTIYTMIVEFISKLAPPLKGTSYEKIISVAPEVLTLITLAAYPMSLSSLVDESKGLTEKVLRSIVNESIEDLLDNELIISILEGR